MLMRTLFIFVSLFGLTGSSLGQAVRASLKPGSEVAKAFAFFEQIEARSFDDYLKRVRLPKVSAAIKAKALTLATKGDGLKVTNRMREKLAALTSILNFHERDSVIEIRVIGVEELYIGLLARAVLMISESALHQLSVEELQAIVAHELGHEYFWGELVEARQHNQLEMIREIEMRCDGIAVITLRRLGLDPAKLAVALTKIKAFNVRLISLNSRTHPRLDERLRFIRAMDELVQSKQGLQAVKR